MPVFVFTIRQNLFRQAPGTWKALHFDRPDFLPVRMRASWRIPGGKSLPGVRAADPFRRWEAAMNDIPGWEQHARSKPRNLREALGAFAAMTDRLLRFTFFTETSFTGSTDAL